MEAKLQAYVEEAQNSTFFSNLKEKITSVTDLTFLNETSNENDIQQVIEKAKNYSVPVICIESQWIAFAKTQIVSETPKIATVANFPSGQFGFAELFSELDEILALNPHEIDIVFPYSLFLQGDKSQAFQLIERYRQSVPQEKKLKVIIETGAFENLKALAEICQELILMEVDFLKTSTGKKLVGAEPLKSALILQCIEKFSHKKLVGFKASGGIRELHQAKLYLNLAYLFFGETYLRPETFRIGASQLLDRLDD